MHNQEGPVFKGGGLIKYENTREVWLAEERHVESFLYCGFGRADF